MFCLRKETIAIYATPSTSLSSSFAQKIHIYICVHTIFFNYMCSMCRVQRATCGLIVCWKIQDVAMGLKLQAQESMPATTNSKCIELYARTHTMHLSCVYKCTYVIRVVKCVFDEMLVCAHNSTGTSFIPGRAGTRVAHRKLQQTHKSIKPNQKGAKHHTMLHRQPPQQPPPPPPASSSVSSSSVSSSSSSLSAEG